MPANRLYVSRHDIRPKREDVYRAFGEGKHFLSIGQENEMTNTDIR